MKSNGEKMGQGGLQRPWRRSCLLMLVMLMMLLVCVAPAVYADAEDQHGLTAASATDITAQRRESSDASWLTALLSHESIARRLTLPTGTVAALLMGLGGAAIVLAACLFYAWRLRKAAREVTDALLIAEHAHQAKSNFLNQLSHDIRTPMNAIIGFASLATSHLEDGRLLEEDLKKVIISSRHLLATLNELLDMNRLEGGADAVQEQACYLPEIIHELHDMLQVDMSARRLHFRISVVHVTQEHIRCDTLRLTQVLMNCISNAIKFTMPGGTVGLKIIQRGERAADGRVDMDFIIRDTGIGMSEEFVEHMFEPFSREQTSTVSGIPGSGLGMAIVRHHVDAMGGSIAVTSRKGEGTTLTIHFRFPVEDGAEAERVNEDWKGLRALVVEEDETACASVAEMLTRLGMRTEWTISGRHAAEMVQQAHDSGMPYRVIVLSKETADEDGLEIAGPIRRAAAGDQLSLLLCTYDTLAVERKARQAGVTACCVKPLFLSELRAALTEAAAARPGERQEGFCCTHRPHILLVEDNDLNREITTAFLEGMNVDIDTAENGKVAVEMVSAAAEGYYSLVLMDIQMPVMDGYEATRRIRALDREDVRTLPIIAVSANAIEADRQKAEAAGMSDYLSKPFHQRELKALFMRYLPSHFPADGIIQKNE